MRNDDRSTSEWLFDAGMIVLQIIAVCAIIVVISVLLLLIFKEGGFANALRIIRNVVFWIGVAATVVFVAIEAVGFVLRCADD